MFDVSRIWYLEEEVSWERVIGQGQEIKNHL
jgi:hypothetical protein